MDNSDPRPALDVDRMARTQEDLLKAKNDCKKKMSELCDLEAKLREAGQTLRGMAPDCPMSALGDLLRSENGERRRVAAAVFERTVQKVMMLKTNLLTFQDILRDLCSIAESCATYKELVTKYNDALPAFEIAAAKISSLGGMKIMSWVVSGVAGIAVSLVVGMVLKGAFALMSKIPVITALVVAVAFLVGGIIAGEERMKAFEKAKDDGLAIEVQVDRALGEMDNILTEMNSKFREMRLKLEAGGFVSMAGEACVETVALGMARMVNKLECLVSSCEIYEEAVREGMNESAALRIAARGINLQGWDEDAKKMLLKVHIVLVTHREDPTARGNALRHTIGECGEEVREKINAIGSLYHPEEDFF